jgi:fluoroquinolone resistance protein
VRFDQAEDFFREAFRGVSLGKGERLDRRQFDECTFTDCSLQETEILDCTFRDCSFTDCNLSVAKLTNSRFAGVTFRRSKLTGIDWTATQWSSVGSPITFEARCVLDLGVFMGLRLPNAAFRDSSAHEVDFSDTDLSGCDFTGTDLAQARFNRTNLTKARLEGAYHYTIDLGSNTLKGASSSLPEGCIAPRSLWDQDRRSTHPGDPWLAPAAPGTVRLAETKPRFDSVRERGGVLTDESRS